MSKFTLIQVGDTGSGKTHRALTATQFGPVYLIDMDQKGSGIVKKLNLGDQVKHVVCKNAEDVVAAIKDLEANITKYSTLVFDTWSAWHDYAIDHYLRNNKANRPRTVSFDGQAQESLSQQDWGAIKAGNKRMTMKLLGLDVNLIVNTHVGKATTADDRQVLTIGTTGSFGEEMPRWFEETHQLGVDFNNKSFIKGKATGRFIANTQLPESFLDTKGDFIDKSLMIFKDRAKVVK